MTCICSICLEIIDDHNVVTPCGHKFHTSCMTHLFTHMPSPASCPECRMLLSEVEHIKTPQKIKVSHLIRIQKLEERIKEREKERYLKKVKRQAERVFKKKAAKWMALQTKYDDKNLILQSKQGLERRRAVYKEYQEAKKALETVGL